MADFHEYYSGARVAPCLTVFIGGNHEASNHLFELYYGGWVAPNIYYLGAANVLRLGPLRIASLSGIWKGYDYRKPHYERLPYSREETTSIFHVRELDVRKLLAIRTQVDIGLSHDWPQSIEWQGDYKWLFKKKDLFEEDAKNGKLGSVAARHCLERLRPAHWFSAHLHIKYAAVIQHDDYQPESRWRSWEIRRGADASSETASTAVSGDYSTASEGLTLSNGHPPASAATSSKDRPQVSAWQNFHVRAARDEAKETSRILQERQDKQEEQARTGKRRLPQYTFDETWKQVSTDENLGRAITAVSNSVGESSPSRVISNLDGCCESSLRQPKISGASQSNNNPDEIEISEDESVPSKVVHTVFPTHNHVDVPMPSSAKSTSESTKNVDEIDVDEDDGEGAGTQNTKETSQPQLNGTASSLAPSSMSRNADKIEIDPSEASDVESSRRLIKTVSDPNKASQMYHGTVAAPISILHTPVYKVIPRQGQSLMSDDSEEGGAELNPVASSFTPVARIPQIAEDEVSKEAGDLEDEMATKRKRSTEDGVSEEMRAQLASLSSNFAEPQHVKVSARLPLPESIHNKETRFLALDKCEPHREFLQLLEVESISEPHPTARERPYKLQYDKEWLAILRVFAQELELGSAPTDAVPISRGDTYYRERIIDEEKWVEEHVEEPGQMTIPNNFVITAPAYDPDQDINSGDMPREYTNPQTSNFCQLIGIENKFDFPEEERDARMAQGPRPEQEQSRRGGYYNRGGGGRGRGRGSWHSRGGYGGRGGGRGGRGRGGRYRDWSG